MNWLPVLTQLCHGGGRTGRLRGAGVSRRRGRCCWESRTCHRLRGARSGSRSLHETPVAPQGERCASHGEWIPQLGRKSGTGHGDSDLRPSNHTLSPGQNWGNSVSCVLTPLYLLPSIRPYLRLPYPGGDAVVGAGEEELRANNSNRNRVEPFQLFICQMESFPALFFFSFCYKNKKKGGGEH